MRDAVRRHDFSQVAADRFERIIVFGDSLSDSGNLHSLSGHVFPPSSIEREGERLPGYFRGRSSNGPVWIELLPGYSSHLNFAQAGALTNHSTNASALAPGARGVRAQITAFHGWIGPHDLVVLWSGANDLIAKRRPADVAADQTGNILTLIAKGARTILVPNLPDIGATPGLMGSPMKRTATLATIGFNTLLKRKIASIRLGKGIDVIGMDVFRAMNVVMASPASFGFREVRRSCVSTCFGLTASPSEQNQYLFWDDIHPTAAAHKLLALYAWLLLFSEHGRQARPVRRSGPDIERNMLTAVLAGDAYSECRHILR